MSDIFWHKCRVPARGGLAPNDLYRLINGQNWLKMVNFQKYSHVCGLGTLNLSQEMSDKMKNESGHFFYTEPRKRQKNCQNWPFLVFFWSFGCLLWSKWTHWHECYKILAGIFWHKGLIGLKWPVQPQKWPIKAKKWPKMVNLKKYSHVCGVGTLNLSILDG